MQRTFSSIGLSRDMFAGLCSQRHKATVIVRDETYSCFTTLSVTFRREAS